jgi:hypothetical protein
MRTGLEKPDWIAKDEDANWHWDLVVKSCPTGVLKALDTAVLIQACRWWSVWRAADRLIASMAIPEPSLVTLADKAANRWQRAASPIGLSPTDRARIHVDSQPEKKGVASRERRA